VWRCKKRRIVFCLPCQSKKAAAQQFAVRRLCLGFLLMVF
jgi:hypothetical protein